MSWLRWSHQRQYAVAAYRQAPVTFIRRVVLGQDPYWRRYFWSRWGWLPPSVLDSLRGGPVVWIDVISGGEVTQSVSFCRLLRKALPQHRLLLSTNSRYSYEFASATLAVDAVIDSPWDLAGPVSRMLATVSPVAVIGIENLTSPVLFREARRRRIVTILVSGLMRGNFHLHKMMQRTVELEAFGQVDWVGAKSDDDARGFIGMGAPMDRVVRSGDMKFDLDYLHVCEEERDRLRHTLRLDADERVLLAGSLHPAEEQLIGEAYLEARQTIAGLRLVCVPRYQFHAEPMQKALQSLGLPCVRKSMLGAHRLPSKPVVIVDTFGELSRLYSIASVVFLGGSTYVRNIVGAGQNPIEPLAQKRPIFFGPVMNLWRDVTQDLKDVWSGVEVTNSKDLAAGIIAVLSSPLLTARLAERIEKILVAHRQDVSRNVSLVVSALAHKVGEQCDSK